MAALCVSLLGQVAVICSGGHLRATSLSRSGRSGHRRPFFADLLQACAVGLVYTPPEHRGRGYATACVATLTRNLLADGVRECLLFTDLANPISNAIYARIGYAPRLDFEELSFAHA